MAFRCRNKNKCLGFVVCVLIFRPEMSVCQARCAVSQLADIRKVCFGSCRNNFSGLGHLIISGAEFPSSFPWAQRSQSASALIYPLSLSHQSPPPPPHHPLHLPLPSAPCSLCRAKKRGLTSPRGDVLLLTQGLGSFLCHAFTFANFRVCLEWQLESLVSECRRMASKRRDGFKDMEVIRFF